MYRVLRMVPLVALLLFLLACSTIIDGDSETLTFNTNPSGADCTLHSNDHVVGEVITPGQVTVHKTKDDINVVCTKAGYEDGKELLKSDVAAATFGNIVFGGLGGWAIDSARGSDNKYQETNVITLTAKTAVGRTQSGGPNVVSTTTEK